MSGSDEAQLVTLARGLFGGAPQGEVQMLLFDAWPAPAKISPEALRVLEDTLAKGAVLWLVKQGGWRERLWAKRVPPKLQFSGQVVALLQWLLDQPLGREGPHPLRMETASGLACELVLLAALATVVGTPAERGVACQEAVRASVLCGVAFPAVIAQAGGAPLAAPFDDGQDFALAALQPALARWWRAAERLKARLLVPSDVVTHGRAQARALDALLAWAEQNDKRERCTFLLEALAPMLDDKASAADFVAELDVRLPLRDRHAARQAASATLHGLARLEAWDEHARTVRFIDDGYDAAQARVRTYEAVFGRSRFLTAHRLRDELAALPG